MIKQFLLNLFISSFCLSIDIKLEINENYLQNRSFNFQLNFNQQIFKCFILYKFEEENIKIEGIELEKNKKYLFKNVDRNFHIFNKKGEIIGKNEEYLNAEFCIEILNNPLLEIIPSAKNQVNIFILT